MSYSSLRRLSGWVVLLGCVRSASADNFVFTPFCDNVWQTCCELNSETMVNNWARTSPAPVCPVQPNGLDSVTILTDCIVGPTAGPAAGVLFQSNGTFTLGGPLQIGESAEFEGPFVWNSGELTRSGGASGQYAVVYGGLTIQGSAPKTLAGLGGFRLVNAGAATWSGSGSWTIGMIPGGCCPSIFELLPGSTMSVMTDAPILATAFGTGRLENAGQITKQSSSGVSNWAVDLINTGTLRVSSGTVELARSGQSSGLFVVDGGAELAFAGGNYELLPGANITGAGRAVVRGSGTGNGVVVNSNLTLDRLEIASDGRIGGTGLLRVANLFTMAGFCPLSLEILPGALLDVQTTVPTARFGVIDVGGVAEIAAGKVLATAAALTVDPGGEIRIADGGTLGPAQVGGGGAVPIENHGSIRKLPGAGVGLISGTSPQTTLNNREDGVLRCDEGTLEIGKNLGSWGEISIAAGATVRQRGWATYHPGTTFAGDGWFHIDHAGNNSVATGYTLTVPRLRISGVWNAGDGLYGPGNLTITDRLELRGGVLNLPVVTIVPGATLESIGPGFFSANNAIIENHGVMRIFEEIDWSQLNNRPGATLEIAADVQYGTFFHDTIVNQGLVVKSGGAGESIIGGPITNSGGTLRIESGLLNCARPITQSAGAVELAGGNLTIPNGQPVTLNGGRLHGAGLLGAVLINNAGAVAPGNEVGALLVGGNYSQGAGGSLRIQLGGTAEGQFDRLAVTGNAALNGGLNLERVNGFVPQLGDQFTILTTTGTRSGTLGQVSGVQIGGGLKFAVSYTASSVVVSVVTGGTTPGDLDGDGTVGQGDLAGLLSSYGLCHGDAGFNPAADLNGDGCVGQGDLALLLANYGS